MTNQERVERIAAFIEYMQAERDRWTHRAGGVSFAAYYDEATKQTVGDELDYISRLLPKLA